MRYLVIIFAFLFSALFISKDKNSYLTVGALAFTLVADLFLVIINPAQQLLGMIFFCGAQFFHASRVHFFFESKMVRSITLMFRVAAIFAVQIVTVIVLGDAYDALSAISMLYFTNIILNTVYAFVHFKRQPVYALGMLLFVFCDVFVGLSGALGTYFTASKSSIIYKIANPPFDAAWMFYAPSQTLISISSHPTIYKNSKGGRICNR